MDSSSSSASHLFGRRKGRPLRVRKTRLMEELLPRVLLSLDGACQSLDLAPFFKRPDAPLWLEIGFGGGEHLAAQAVLNPKTNFIGCEPFENGVASLLDHLDREALDNVRVFTNDARLVLDALPSHCLERCYILFADPWPKKRHRERRFVGPENLSRLLRVLKPGALLRMASDHPELIAWMRETMAGAPGFIKVFDDVIPPAGWIATRYQEKAALAQRQAVFLDYQTTSDVQAL